MGSSKCFDIMFFPVDGQLLRMLPCEIKCERNEYELCVTTYIGKLVLHDLTINI